MTSHKPKLIRFINAQLYGDNIGCPLKTGLLELSTKFTKTKHWSWYGFPQLIGLSISNMGIKYAIHNLQEAIEYLSDSILRTNLINTYIVILNALKHNNFDLNQTLGVNDSNKLKSSVTLFYYAYQSIKPTNIKNSKIIDQLHSLLGNCQFTCNSCKNQILSNLVCRK